MNQSNANGSRMATVDMATMHIRNKIILGEYPKGSVVTEAQFADDCGISRGSVRSALGKLETEGLVLSKPNGRKEITGISEAYIHDLYAMRWELEKKSIETVMGRKEMSDYEYIGSIVGTLGKISQPSPDIKDIGLMATSDKIFHGTLIEISNNRVLMSCWNVIEPVVWTLQSNNAIYCHKVNDYETHVAVAHSKMIKLLLNRDSEIFALLKTHIQDAEDATLQVLRERKSI